MHDYSERKNAFYSPKEVMKAEYGRVDASKILILRMEENSEALEFPQSDPSVEVRSVRIPRFEPIPEGLYAFKNRGNFELLFVLGGSASETERASADLSKEFGSAYPGLFSARRIFDEVWGVSNHVARGDIFQDGDWAELVGAGTFGRVAGVVPTIEQDWVELDIDGARKTFSARDLKKLGGDPRSLRTWISGTPADSAGLSSLLTWAKLSNSLSDTLYSFAATRTVFRPYQFLPALKILASERGRLLVADEVGLGKTIEAGLIWAELEQRIPLNRVLVITPASLTYKWQQELRRRFMREIPVWKAKEAREFVSRFKDSSESRCAAIISLESLRGARDVLEQIELLKISFDLIILDEAHQARNARRKAYQLVEVLAEHTENLIFLSATPLNLGHDDFFNLMHLLEPDLYPDQAVFVEQIEPNKYLNEINRLVQVGNYEKARTSAALIPTLRYGTGVAQRPAWKELLHALSESELDSAALRSRIRELCVQLNTISGSFTRTRKRDVPDDKALREVRDIEVIWTQEERDFYDAVRAHYEDVARKTRRPAAFILQMPLRQTCSSIPVMQSQLRARGLHGIAEVATTMSDYAEMEDLTELLDVDEDEPFGDVELLATLPMTSMRQDVTDSKLSALLKHLEELPNLNASQALIFTYSRGTVNYLADKLSNHYKVGYLHGGVKPDDRNVVIQDFREGKYDILVANQVGSEGLDFQCCNVLINYDMPWNPMQVEQRIGRIDRFGQTSEKIFIFNMKVPNTIETDIFTRLYDRIGLFKDSVGDLEPILLETLSKINRELLLPGLTDIEREARLSQLAIAIENEKKNIEEIETRGDLAITAHVEIAGLSASGPANGKFIGEAELLALVKRITEMYGAELVEVQKEPGFYRLKGNPELAQKISRLPNWETGTTHSSMFVGRLSQGDPLKVVFNSGHLLRQDHNEVDIVSSRHPLVRLAVQEQNEVTLLPLRFGRCLVHNPDLAGSYLALVSLVSSQGVSAKNELWVTAVNASDFLRSEGVETLLMEALSAGRLKDSDLTLPNIQFVLRQLQDMNSQRQNEAAAKRQQENDAVLGLRKQSELQLINRKLDRLERTQRDGGGIEAILRSQIASARAALLAVDEKFDGLKDVHFSSQPVALVQIEIC